MSDICGLEKVGSINVCVCVHNDLISCFRSKIRKDGGDLPAGANGVILYTKFADCFPAYVAQEVFWPSKSL